MVSSQRVWNCSGGNFLLVLLYYKPLLEESGRTVERGNSDSWANKRGGLTFSCHCEEPGSPG
ncbi:MAG: hypothetical protein P8Y37_10550, partial [Anaerolineales bacterium]